MAIGGGLLMSLRHIAQNWALGSEDARRELACEVAMSVELWALLAAAAFLAMSSVQVVRSHFYAIVALVRFLLLVGAALPWFVYGAWLVVHAQGDSLWTYIMSLRAGPDALVCVVVTIVALVVRYMIGRVAGTLDAITRVPLTIADRALWLCCLLAVVLGIVVYVAEVSPCGMAIGG
mgnify:CR=1 FL=1